MTDQLDELAVLCMNKVECPNLDNVVPREAGCASICVCQGTGEILDPQQANLREVLWELCAGCINHVGEDCSCRYCDRGYIRRTWNGPDWWLATLIREAASKDGINLTRLMYHVDKPHSETIVSVVLAAVVKQNSPQRSQSR